MFCGFCRKTVVFTIDHFQPGQLIFGIKSAIFGHKINLFRFSSIKIGRFRAKNRLIDIHLHSYAE